MKNTHFIKLGLLALVVFACNAQEPVTGNRIHINNSHITMKDVIGDVKADIQEIIDQLKNPDKYSIKVSPTMLLYGPLGTGKSQLAEAIAGETNRKIITCKAPMDNYVGTGPTTIRDLFALARQSGNCIILFEEVDGYFGKRTDANHHEYDAMLSVLLSEISELPNDLSIFFIATTNKMEKLDPALLGRIADALFEITIPNTEKRTLLIKHYFNKHKIMYKEEWLKEMAKTTHGLDCRQLEKLATSAARKSIADKNNTLLAIFNAIYKKMKEDFDKINKHQDTDAIQREQLELNKKQHQMAVKELKDRKKRERQERRERHRQHTLQNVNTAQSILSTIIQGGALIHQMARG